MRPVMIANQLQLPSPANAKGKACLLEFLESPPKNRLAQR